MRKVRRISSSRNGRLTFTRGLEESLPDATSSWKASAPPAALWKRAKTLVSSCGRYTSDANSFKKFTGPLAVSAIPLGKIASTRLRKANVGVKSTVTWKASALSNRECARADA